MSARSLPLVALALAAMPYPSAYAGGTPRPRPETPSMPFAPDDDAAPSRTMRDALEALLSRGDGAFVVFEDARSKKFVQFAGSRSEPLLLDLPAKALTGDERARAAQLFASLGVPRSRWEVTDRSGRKTVDREAIFQLELSRDVARGAELAVRVFREVYRLQGSLRLNVETEE